TPALHSFPTRRSSDLDRLPGGEVEVRAARFGDAGRPHGQERGIRGARDRDVGDDGGGGGREEPDAADGELPRAAGDEGLAPAARSEEHTSELQSPCNL